MSAAPDLGIVVGELRGAPPAGLRLQPALCARVEVARGRGARTSVRSAASCSCAQPVFEQVGGFNETVIAGEDSELGLRIARRRLPDHEDRRRRWRPTMPTCVRFSPVVASCGSFRPCHRPALQPARHAGPTRDSARERRSVLVWGVAIPRSIMLLAPFTRGASRLARRPAMPCSPGGSRATGSSGATRRQTHGSTPAYTVLGKFAEAVGMLKFHLNRMSGRYRIIEYK